MKIELNVLRSSLKIIFLTTAVIQVKDNLGIKFEVRDTGTKASFKTEKRDMCKNYDKNFVRVAKVTK